MVTTVELQFTVAAAFETTAGALSAEVPAGILSKRTFVEPPVCNQAGMFLMTTLTAPVTPPLLPTTIVALAAHAS